MVPVEQKGEHCERCERRARQRQYDAPEAPETRGPVHAGRILELSRDRQEKLPQEEHPERRERLRDDQTLVGVHPVELLYQDELRDDGNLRRDHEGAEIEQEDQIATRELQ